MVEQVFNQFLDLSFLIFFPPHEISNCTCLLEKTNQLNQKY